MIKLDEEQLKTLKLFSYYCGSHGASRVTKDVYLTDGGIIDWMDPHWYSETGTRVEDYDKISSLINTILTSDLFDDYYFEGSGRVDIELYVKERKLTINLYHTEYGTENSSMVFEDFDSKEFTEFFNELSGLSGVLDFSGSGDSGWIEDNIRLPNGSVMKCPQFLEDWAYHQLGINYGGWEINEGSQGSFVIDTMGKYIRLDFGMNTEETVSDGEIYSVSF